MNTEPEYYLVTHGKLQGLKGEVYTNLADLMELLANSTGLQTHKIELESRHTPKGRYCTLLVDGKALIEKRTIPMFDLQCELKKHSGLNLALSELVIKSAETVSILVLPNQSSVN